MIRRALKVTKRKLISLKNKIIHYFNKCLIKIEMIKDVIVHDDMVYGYRSVYKEDEIKSDVRLSVNLNDYINQDTLYEENRSLLYHP